MSDEFGEKLTEFDRESERFLLQQKIDHRQFEVDFWTNAENSTKSNGSVRNSYVRRRLSAEKALLRVRGQLRNDR